MGFRVKNYAYVHHADFDHEAMRDSKEFDKIANVCISRATEALKNPTGTYTQRDCNQISDLFRSLTATQRGIRRMLDFEGPIDPETVDVLLLARLQLEVLFSLCFMFEDSSHATLYVQDFWRKQYVEYLIIREEVRLLPRFQSYDNPERQRLGLLGVECGIDPAHAPTIEHEELGVPMPDGMEFKTIEVFPSPGRIVRKITSSPWKKRMLQRVYAKYVYLCSFSHGLGQANLFKNIFDKRFPDRRLYSDAALKDQYRQQVESEAYLSSFLSIAQCTAELSILYPNDMGLVEAALRAWEQLRDASLLTKAVWEIRTKSLLKAIL